MPFIVHSISPQVYLTLIVIFWIQGEHLVAFPNYQCVYRAWPPQKNKNDKKTEQSITVIFFTLLDRASFPHYNNTKIINFGWELFILWVISYGLSFSGFARFPEFRGTINDSFSSKYMYMRQHFFCVGASSQPATKKSQCQQITEHNTHSILDGRTTDIIDYRNRYLRLTLSFSSFLLY